MRKDAFKIKQEISEIKIMSIFAVFVQLFTMDSKYFMYS